MANGSGNGAERQRERMAEELRSAHATQRHLLRAQEFLLGAARVLAQASDYAEALNRLAAVAVPPLGDLCLIDVLDDDGRLLRMAARHADPDQQAIVEQLRTRYGPDPEGGHPSVDVIHTGQSMWSSEMTEEFLQATTRDEHHLLLVHQLQFTSYMSVPLTSRGRVLGSLTIVSAGSGRRFVEEDLLLVEELAGHAAAVIVRARSHDRDRDAAHTLQRSLLPSQLPVVAGIAIAARYLPGTEGAEIGGDWYDVIPLDDGAVGLVIGDVAGHDIGAAAEMGQLRNALRAYAICDDSPARVLHQLRHFCEVVGVERIATVTYIWLSPATGELRSASAGHFAPLIRRASGAIEATDHWPAPPLGIESDPPPEAQARIGPGDIVILHTDGLVERRDADLDEGLDRLIALVGAAPSLDPGAVCDFVIAGMLPPDTRSDDVALLVLQAGIR
jgi:stage II sporulation SpoE-like protein/GAF domain-containing protein